MSDEINSGRRKLVFVAASAGACVGAAAAIPFAASMLPSERAKALGAPVEADISRMVPGEMQVLEWRGKPVWIIRRTPEMLTGIKKSDALVADPKSEVKQQPDYAKNDYRSIKEEFLVVVRVDFDRDEVTTEQIFHCRIGENLSLHSLAGGTPVCVKMNQEGQFFFFRLAHRHLEIRTE